MYFSLSKAYDLYNFMLSIIIALTKEGKRHVEVAQSKATRDKGSFLGTKLKDGDRVIMIEDVTTSGKSMEETVPKVKNAANVEIKGLMVSLDRAEKGKSDKSALAEVSELYGFPTAAIVSVPEIVDSLRGRNMLDEKLEADLKHYYEQYGASDKPLNL